MLSRSIDEPHRAASQLELLFDLTFVVAVAAGTSALAHSITEGHAVDGVIPFLQVFFAIWWAWMNFTWFASSYDTDDPLYRLLTLVQMAGVLVLAAGVPAAEDGDFRVVTLGYLIMRAGLIALWLRAGNEDLATRATARRYAMGITVAEVGWLSRLAIDEAHVVPELGMRLIFFVLVAVELCVPRWSERPRPTTWHPHHIAERYGLFTIILLGEGVLAASMGVDEVVARGDVDASLVAVAVAGLVLVFSLWWMYFLEPCGEGLVTHRDRSYVWGYGHYGIFASLAALSGGLKVAVQHTGDEAAVSPLVVSYAVAIPVAAFLALLSVVNGPLVSRRAIRPALSVAPAAAILLLPLATSVVGPTVVISGIAAVSAGTVVASLRTSK